MGVDDAQRDPGPWPSVLARFKDLVRPEGLDPLGTAEEGVEAARGAQPAQTALGVISAALPDLVFEGCHDWYGYPDAWVLAHLDRVLSGEEEQQILGRLGAGTSPALADLLDYLADQLRGAWQHAARQVIPPTIDGGPAFLTGAPNTQNWQADRIPGTYYYAYGDNEYVYCDMHEALAGQWAPLPVRERQAAEKAQPWQDSGWLYTPVAATELYGGAYVYAAGRAGPWMDLQQATAQLAARRYTKVKQVEGYPEWAQGFDKQDQVWKYARLNGSRLPGQDDSWTALGSVRLHDTERFAGPGYSVTGWVPNPATQGADTGKGPGKERLPPYNTEKPTAEDDAVEAAMEAALDYFTLKGWPNAEKMLQHYLDRSGSEISIDPETLMRDVPGFAQVVRTYLAGQKGKQSFDSGWQNTNTDKTDSHGKLDQQSFDWYYALHDWRYRIHGGVDAGHGAVTFRYTVEVFKPYVFGSPRGDIAIPGTRYLPGGPIHISQEHFKHLNTTGRARDFDVVGKATLTYVEAEK